MTITNQTVKVYRGDTATVTVTLAEAPAAGASLKWRMARTKHSLESTALARKEIGEGIELNAAVVTISLAPADTDQVPGLYHHELKIQVGAEVTTAMTGTLVIKRALQMGDRRQPAAANLSLSAEAPTVS